MQGTLSQTRSDLHYQDKRFQSSLRTLRVLHSATLSENLSGWRRSDFACNTIVMRVGVSPCHCGSNGWCRRQGRQPPPVDRTCSWLLPSCTHILHINHNKPTQGQSCWRIHATASCHLAFILCSSTRGNPFKASPVDGTCSCLLPACTHNLRLNHNKSLNATPCRLKMHLAPAILHLCSSSPSPLCRLPSGNCHAATPIPSITLQL